MRPIIETQGLLKYRTKGDTPMRYISAGCFDDTMIDSNLLASLELLSGEDFEEFEINDEDDDIAFQLMEILSDDFEEAFADGVLIP